MKKWILIYVGLIIITVLSPLTQLTVVLNALLIIFPIVAGMVCIYNKISSKAMIMKVSGVLSFICFGFSVITMAYVDGWPGLGLMLLLIICLSGIWISTIIAVIIK